jgi:hypothetical protein
MQILEQLAPVCDPLVLVSDAEGLPMVVFGPGQVVYGQAPANPEASGLPTPP